MQYSEIILDKTYLFDGIPVFILNKAKWPDGSVMIFCEDLTRIDYSSDPYHCRNEGAKFSSSDLSKFTRRTT